MQMPSRLGILFNGAALLIVGASAAAVVRYTFMADDIAACSTRYEHGTQLSLARPNGELLTPADLQARSSGTDWGLQNARIIEARGAPAKQAIEVRFVPANASSDASGKMGMGFTWAPRSASKPAAACLTYSVFVARHLRVRQGRSPPGVRHEYSGPGRYRRCRVEPHCLARVGRARAARANGRLAGTAPRGNRHSPIFCRAGNGYRWSRKSFSMRRAQKMAPFGCGQTAC